MRAFNPQALADRWAETFDRSMWWMKGISGVRERALVRRLIYHLAVSELEWADPRMRKASEIRARQIVEEIGWPEKAWLDRRVKAEVARRNAVHAWAESGYAGELPDQGALRG